MWKPMADFLASIMTSLPERLAHWEDGDAARFAHPREEHLIPLMVAAGAGGEDRGVRVYGGEVVGWVVSGFRVQPGFYASDTNLLSLLCTAQ